MGPGKVTTEAGGWITTVESGHCRTQGSLQVSARGAGVATPQLGTHRLEQDILETGEGFWKTSPRRRKGVREEWRGRRQREIAERFWGAVLTWVKRGVEWRSVDGAVQGARLFYTARRAWGSVQGWGQPPLLGNYETTLHKVKGRMKILSPPPLWTSV